MKTITCIVCPNGCALSCEKQADGWRITGNQCKRGYAFALAEMTDPKRTVCSTVRTAFADMPMLPVRTSREIPKARIFDVMAAINAIYIEKPVRRGDVLVGNVLGLSADIIATADTPQAYSTL